MTRRIPEPLRPVEIVAFHILFVEQVLCHARVVVCRQKVEDLLDGPEQSLLRFDSKTMFAFERDSII